MDRRDRQRGLLTHVGDFLRWLGFLLLVTAGLALAVFYFIQTRLDEEIRAHLEGKFQRQYPDLVVSVRAARRVPGRGIEIRGLSIMSPAGAAAPVQLAFVDELLVRCDTTLPDLISGRANAQQIVARGLKLQATRYADGSWSLARLLPLPSFGDQSPPVRIESGAVEILDKTDDRVQAWMLHDIDLTVVPLALAKAGGPAPPVRVTGRLSGSHFKQLELDGRIDLTGMQWSVGGTVEDLQVSAATIAALPADLRAQCQLLESLRGQVQLNFRAHNRSQAPSPLPWQFALAGVFRGRIQDARLPRTLTDVEATFRCDERSVVVERFAARAGQTRLAAAASLAGWRADQPCQLQLHAEHLLLDDAFQRALPDRWQDLWQQFQPQGVVDAQLNLQFDGRLWTHDLQVKCRDVSFAYHKFPYRLTAAQGLIRFQNGILKLEPVDALASGRPVRIQAEIANPGRDFTGWLEVSANEPIPVDKRLIDALPVESQDVVRSLDPHGKVTVWGRYEREVSTAEPSCRLEVGLHDCAVNYSGFRYPVYRIRGTLRMLDDRWSFRGVEGFNDSGFILCDGGWGGGSPLWLDFTATDVSLEDELRDALNPEAQRVWNSIYPRGTIDHLKVAVRHSPEVGLSIDVTAHKSAPSQNVEGRSITIKPSWLPYQLDHLIGTVRFQGGQVQLENIRAKHGQTDVELNGHVAWDEGGWRVVLSRLNVDRLLATHEFTSALPPVLGRAVAALHVTGPVSISGGLELAGRQGEWAPRSALWQLAFDVENGGIDCGVQLDHLHGAVTLQGQYDARGFYSYGMLDFDSLIYKGIQLTGVQGPLTIDAQRVAFGQWTSGALPNQPPPQPITASTFGGQLSGSGEFWLADSRFELEAALEDAELALISREAMTQQLDISGRTYGTLRLRGTTSGFHTLRGHGQVQLRQANVYELPLMIRLLKLLRIKPPDDTAFTSSDVKFRVEEDIIYFDQILFEGDAISLEGRGEMNLERAINLTFDTSVGRDDGQLLSVLVRPFLKEAGRRLMLLRVTGTLDDPRIDRIPFPDVNETIQQVFPNNGEPPGPAMSRLPTPGQFLDRFRSR